MRAMGQNYGENPIKMLQTEDAGKVTLNELT
jgi:hypothetical protein